VTAGRGGVRINCIGQLGLGLLPLGPQPIRVGEAQPLVLLPPLAAAPLAAGPRRVSPPYIMYPLLINTGIQFLSSNNAK
jgi:hypothetical protein